MSRIGRFGASATILALAALISSTVVSPVAADDTAPVNGLVVSTTFDGETLPPALDSSPTNGIVATNDPVGFSWSFTAARDLVGAQIVQTLPAGWKWSTAATDALLADIAAYQSTATISADLRTLTATLSTSAGAAITLGPLRAIPQPVAENTSYIPTVEVSDSGGAATAGGTHVDVVSGAPRLTVQSSVNLSSSSPGSYNSQLGQTSQAIVTLSLPSYAGQPNIALPAGSQFTMTTAGAKPPTLTGYLGLANATQAGQVTTATIPYALQPGGSATYRLNYFWANSDLANSTVWLNYSFAIADFADFTLSSSSTTATGTNLRGAVTAPSGVWTTYSCQTGWTACDVQVASYNTEPNNLVAADALLRHTVTYSGVKDSTNRSVVEDTVTIGASWDRNVLRLADRPGPIQVRVIINGVYSTPDAVIEYYDAVDRAWVTTLDSSNLARYTEVRAILTTPWPAGVATPQVLLVVLLEGMVTGATQSAISGSWLSSWSGPEALPTKVIRKIRLVPLQDQATFTVSPTVLTAPGTLQYTGKVQIRTENLLVSDGLGAPGSTVEPYYTPSSLLQDKRDSIKWLDLSRATDAQMRAFRAVRVQQGDLLVTRSGSIGRVAYITTALAGAIVSDDAIRVRIGDPKLRAYVFNFLQSRAAQDQLRINEYGSVQQHLEPNHVSNLLIPVPDDWSDAQAAIDDAEAYFDAKENLDSALASIRTWMDEQVEALLPSSDESDEVVGEDPA